MHENPYESTTYQSRITQKEPEGDLFNNLNLEPDENVPPHLFEKLLAPKVHFVVLSILVYLLIYTEVYIIPVFIPFTVCEVAEISFFFRQKEKPTLLYILFLNKISKSKINIIVNIFHIGSKIFKDFTIYMFTFVIMHAGISLFNQMTIK